MTTIEKARVHFWIVLCTKEPERMLRLLARAFPDVYGPGGFSDQMDALDADAQGCADPD